jgi:glycosyltransferase involved in cell wall biosynthesis
MPIKILIISNNYPLSATTSVWAPYCIRDMALALHRAGAEVTVLAPDHQGKRQSDEGIAVYPIPWSGTGERDLASLKLTSFKGLWQVGTLMRNGRSETLALVRRLRPDFCLAAWALPSGWFARVSKRRYGVPYAVWCLGSDIHTWAKKPGFGWLTLRVLSNADLRYADGFELAGAVTKLCDKGCDFLPTTRLLDTAAEQDPSADDRTRFLFVGRWEPVKGIDLLLAAWREAVKQGHLSSALLQIVGQGDGLKSLVEEAAEDPTLKNTVEVLGWVTKEQLAQIYRTTDFVVIPSRNESIPVVLSEALANGKPLIVTAVGDMGDLVTKYGLGRVVAPESTTDLKDAIIHYADHSPASDPKRLADAAALFDLERGVARFLEDVTNFLATQFDNHTSATDISS